MFERLTESSIIGSVFKSSQILLKGVYKNSYIFVLKNKLRGAIKTAYKYSLYLRVIYKISGALESDSLNSSTFVRRIADFYQGFSARVKRQLETSRLAEFMRETRVAIEPSAIIFLGRIMVIAAVTNITLTVLFNRKIILRGGIFSAILLLLAFVCLSFRLNWQSIREDSFIFRLFFNGIPGKYKTLS